MEGITKVRAAKGQIKAIFFDFDGVLTQDKTGSITTLRYLSQVTGVEFNKLRGAFRGHNDDLNLGRTTHSAIWPAICDKVGIQIDRGLLPAAFESTPFNDGMLRLASDLRRNYSVGIITDNKKDRMDHLKAHAKLPALFEPIVVSAEVGSGKESSLIFEFALSRLGASPHECIFIDNTERNLAVPAAMGINTIYFDEEMNDLRGLIETLQEAYQVIVAGAA
ncbi:MAG: HAD-IA family hydrolase [Ramlibacter sp.]